ncbi:MAG TPA: trigger factor [Gallionellaceae bacterium]|nr:trigger factor [Gallionellaceae bacterium]
MSSVETLGALERRLNASIPQQQILGEVAARIKHMGRTAKVPGFRPGKVPFKILEQQFGTQAHQEVLGDELHRSFAEAAKANNLKVAGYPNFEIKTTDMSAPQIEFSATFEVYPEVVVGDVSGESIERVTFSLNDADIDNTIDTLRKQRAVFEPAKRAAQNGDQVRIDFSGTLDGVVFDGGEAKDFSLVLGVGRMLPDFENAIIGMKEGKTKSFDMTFPEDYHGKDVAGKKVTFNIVMHSVEAPRLPELDAEFVKSLGIVDGDVEKLKSEIRNNLRAEAERRIKVRNKDNAMDALLNVAKLEAPKALVESESQRMMQQTMHDMQSRGVNIPKGMQLPANLFAERATKRVKLGLILEALVKQNNLEAKPEQVKALIAEHAQGYEKPEDILRWYAADPARMRDVENLVLEDNVVSWLMSSAKVTDKAVDFNELMGNDK